MMAGTNAIKVSLARLLDLAPLILLIVFFAVFTSVDSRIVTPDNLLQIVVQAAPIAILGLGAMIVLISAGIDLSAGYGVSMCAVIAAIMLRDSGSLIGAIAVVLLAGLLLGLFNGFFIGVLKMESFIVTLGSMTVAQGVTLFLASSGGVLTVNNPTLKTIGIGRTLGIPNLIIVAVVLVLLASFIIKNTNFGLRTFGIGSSLESTRVAGVSIVNQQLLIYIFSGMCTALTALMLVSRVAIVSPNLGGTNLMLDAITATVVGGTSIFGGRGSIVGTLLGALLISLITQAMSIIGINATSLDFYKGLFIVLALVLDSLIRAGKIKLSKRQAIA
jgi:ribose/xylose/arabinose/galactoside ABC-type transport system permease subunit